VQSNSCLGLKKASYAPTIARIHDASLRLHPDESSPDANSSGGGSVLIILANQLLSMCRPGL
jgi:hypothetical protein